MHLTLRKALRDAKFKMLRFAHFIEVALATADWISRVRVLRLIFARRSKDEMSRLIEIAFAHGGIRKSILIESGITHKRVSDLVVLWEMFVRKQYAVPGDVRSIVDVGGNIGASALYFLLYAPRAHIYVLEPNPDLFARLELSFAHEPRITLVNAAVAVADGEVTFYQNQNHLSGSLIERAGTSRAIAVRSITLDSLCRDLGIARIDLLKFDIEGGEYEMLKGLSERVEVNEMIGELHYDLVPALREALPALLKGYAYTEARVHGSRSVMHARRLAI